MSLNYKLIKAASGLGLNYSEIKDLLQVSTEVKIAGWAFCKETRETQILINPKVLKFPLYLIRLILRHEILHYAGYHELEGIENDDLMNLMMDVAINRILHLAYPKQMETLTRRIYSKKSQKTVLALAQPHLLKENGIIKKLKPKIRDTYGEIWDSEEVPSPMSLYYQFLLDSMKEAKEENPFGYQNQETDSEGKPGKSPTSGGAKTQKKTSSQKTPEDTGKDTDETPQKKTSSRKIPKDKEIEKDTDETPPQEIPEDREKDTGETPQKKTFSRKIPENTEDGKSKDLLGQARNQIGEIKREATYSRDYHQREAAINAFSNMASKLFQKILVKTKSGMDVEQVSDFINRLNIRRELEEALDPLMTEASASSRRQLYPYKLSRLGTIYAACGISDLIPFFWNQTPESHKLSVAVYVDTSPSMSWAKEYEVFLIDKLKEVFPSTIIVFSGSVQEISTKEFAQGTYPAGVSTCFNAVIEDFLQRKEDFALIFTDGQSSVGWDNKRRLKESKKRLFALYFSSGSGDIISDLDTIAVNTLTLKLPKRKK